MSTYRVTYWEAPIRGYCRADGSTATERIHHQVDAPSAYDAARRIFACVAPGRVEGPQSGYPVYSYEVANPHDRPAMRVHGRAFVTQETPS